MAKVSVLGVYQGTRRFDRFYCSNKVHLQGAWKLFSFFSLSLSLPLCPHPTRKFFLPADCYAVCETSDKWGTVFLDHPGLTSGYVGGIFRLFCL